MQTLERRLARLEGVYFQRANRDHLRLFVQVIGRDVAGFVAQNGDGQQVERLPGESVATLQARCAAVAPDVIVWRST